MKVFFFAVLVCGISNSAAFGQWQQQEIKTDADFRGLCAVSEKVAWVSGTKGTFGRTTDGGKTWTVGTVPDADKLDFRDVEAFSEDTAYLLSAGQGEESRIYKTVDGGKTWKLQFKNAEPKAFFDALAFWDEKHGIALSDPVDGKFPLIITEDGANWTPLPEKSLPAALANEGAFAASGTCLITRGENDVWFCTGGAKAARVFHSEDRGTTWSVVETPILAGIESAGVFSIAFRDQKRGIIVGGDYYKPNGTKATEAITADGGKTWKLIEKPLPFRSGVAWAKDRWVAVGTSGSDVSLDDGLTWKPLDKEKYNAVAFTQSGDGWGAGPRGRIAKFAMTKKAEPEEVKLWNLKAPNGDGTFQKAETIITVHRPEKPNGAAVVICPGGGYGGLVTGAEGHGIATWLNGHGITGIVLEYRLPKGRSYVPLLDAQRAIRTTRANSKAWGIDPAKVGIIGFSAGGHLASTASTHFDAGDAKAEDEVEKQSSRPDFTILVYPVITMSEKTHGGSRTNLLGKQPDEKLVKLFSNETQVTAKTPPAFMAHAKDDKVVVPENSKAYYDALLAQKVPAKYLELASGGHGLNGYKGPMWDAWQTQSLAWLAELKFIPAVEEKK